MSRLAKLWGKAVWQEGAPQCQPRLLDPSGVGLQGQPEEATVGVLREGVELLLQHCQRWRQIAGPRLLRAKKRPTTIAPGLGCLPRGAGPDP